MKTRKRVFSLKNASALTVVVFVFLASCQKDSSILNSTDTESVNAEAASSAYVSEGSDISANAVDGISGTQYSGGRMEVDTCKGLGDRDDRLKCAVVTIVRTGTITNPSGTITITFDPTCSDARGVKRSGSIMISYSGPKWMPGSYFVISFDNFYRNDVHIEGIDSLKTQLSPDALHLQFVSKLTDGKITFGDGRYITRNHDLTREWIRDLIHPLNSEWLTLKGGVAYGQHKNGNTYQMEITKTLVHRIICLAERVFIPVSGTKVITVTTPTETKQYSIDYGDGHCDNDITVTINNKVKTITVNGEGD